MELNSSFRRLLLVLMFIALIGGCASRRNNAMNYYDEPDDSWESNIAVLNETAFV